MWVYSTYTGARRYKALTGTKGLCGVRDTANMKTYKVVSSSFTTNKVRKTSLTNDVDSSPFLLSDHLQEQQQGPLGRF